MAGLNALIQRLERAASHEVKGRILARVRDTVHGEAVRGFREQRDPYGANWQRRKDPRGTWPILQKTGAGLDSLTARVVADRVVLRIAGYFQFHQSGTRYMVDRKPFPDPAQGLGTWEAPVERAVVEGVRDLMTGRL